MIEENEKYAAINRIYSFIQLDRIQLVKIEKSKTKFGFQEVFGFECEDGNSFTVMLHSLPQHTVSPESCL